MSAVATGLASSAIATVLEQIRGAGIDATADAGALNPAPIGVLVGLPSLTERTLSGWIFTVPVTVVSGDPLSSSLAVDRLYAVADDVSYAINVAAYSPSSFSNGVNAEPLPSVELVAAVLTQPEGI